MNEENQRNQDFKADAGKPQMSYVLEFRHALEALVRVSEHGAAKYGKHTWPRVELQRYLDAEMRHSMAKGIDGNAIDKDSGLPHEWHELWNLAAQIELKARAKEESLKK